jgi:hypothetical protein
MANISKSCETRKFILLEPDGPFEPINELVVVAGIPFVQQPNSKGPESIDVELRQVVLHRALDCVWVGV